MATCAFNLNVQVHSGSYLNQPTIHGNKQGQLIQDNFLLRARWKCDIGSKLSITDVFHRAYYIL